MGSFDDVRKHNVNVKGPAERENYYADQSNHNAGVDMKGNNNVPMALVTL